MPATQGSTTEDAVVNFEAYLAAEDKADTGETTEQQPTQTAEEEQSPEAEASTEEQETSPETEESAEEDADDDQGTPVPEVAPDDALYPVTIDGKVEKLPVKELAGGYLRTADYTRKTQELAEQRRVAESELQSARQAQQQYGQLVPLLHQHLVQTMPREPEIDLINADPVEYMRQKAVFDTHLQRLHGAQAEMQRMNHLQAQEHERVRSQSINAGREKLRETVSEWKDDAKWEAGRKELVDYLTGPNGGYSRDEVSQAADPRALVFARKAMLYDRMMANRPKPVAAKSPQPIRAGSTAKQPLSQGRKALNRLAQTGRPDDFQRAILSSGILE